MNNTASRFLLATAFSLIAAPAFAHVGQDIGVGTTSSFAAGAAHPLGGLDHIAVMVAVGLWAALKGGRALWVWPASFVGIMLLGGLIGMLQIPLPFVEPAILASVVALGLLVALAVDLPVLAGAAIVAVFAIFHGHAHGAEVPETEAGILYMAGFALSTAALHGAGIATALALGRAGLRPLVRLAGAACVVVGIALILEIV
jgi:urease accessory protein